MWKIAVEAAAPHIASIEIFDIEFLDYPN